LRTISAKNDEDRKRKAIFKKGPNVQEEVGAGEGTKAGDAEDQENNEAQVDKDDSVAEGDEEPVHEGFSCNECQMQPIVGARYECLE
jgi:hypothetical protein